MTFPLAPDALPDIVYHFQASCIRLSSRKRGCSAEMRGNTRGDRGKRAALDHPPPAMMTRPSECAMLSATITGEDLLMAAQPIYHDEFDEIMNRFYARLSNYVDARADVLINQLRVQQHGLDYIKTETAKHLEKIEGDIEEIKTETAKHFEKM